MPHVDDDSRATIDYLRSLPPNALVRWTSDHVRPGAPWTTGWIDVRVARGALSGMGWVWTIVRADDPDDPKPGELWCFVWPPDLDIHCVLDPAAGWWVRELPFPAGEPLPSLLAAAYEENARRVGGRYDVRQGWSAGTVCDALSDWAARHAGRRDLRFEWDRDAGPSAVLARVTERAAAPGEVWDLGDGLTVVDGLMDDLLALHPDEAAELTPVLRETGKLLAETRRRVGPSGAPTTSPGDPARARRRP